MAGIVCRYSWTGLRVLDGDTIEVMDSLKAVRIRLVNIDAPEKKQDYGRWSTDMMKSLIAGKTVTVTYFQRDRYGRILGQVYAPDGMNVNQFMVRVGAAWVYEQCKGEGLMERKRTLRT